MLNGLTISVIVPVFNEEKTIFGVITALLKSRCVDEVICVNDGSTDATSLLLQKFGNRINLVNYKKNHGKGYALAQGVKRAKGDIIVFCDGDLIGLEERHILKMCKELVKNKNIKCVLGIPGIKEENKDAFYHLLTGERAFFKKDILPLVNRIKDSGYGVETYLNFYFQKSSRKVIVLPNLRHLTKFQKGLSNGVFESYLREGLDIVKEYAKINGLLNKDLEEQLIKISKVKTWKQLGKNISKVGDKDIRQVLKKYLYQRYFKLYTKNDTAGNLLKITRVVNPSKTGILGFVKISLLRNILLFLASMFKWIKF